LIWGGFFVGIRADKTEAAAGRYHAAPVPISSPGSSDGIVGMMRLARAGPRLFNALIRPAPGGVGGGWLFPEWLSGVARLPSLGGGPRMTAKPNRRLIAALGLVMVPLMASAQPAKINLDRVSGDCSDLNFRFWTRGVTDLLGDHPRSWAYTHYVPIINSHSMQEHIARNLSDLLQSFSIQKFTRQDPSGPRTCLRATNFDFRFAARTSITRLHWEPLFRHCQPCESEWANHVTFMNAHERKHLSHVTAAIETASSEWPPTRVIEVCGPTGGIVGDLHPKLANEIGLQLRETSNRLDLKIKADAAALDNREPLGPLDCSACRCEVPAECKSVTVGPDKMKGGAPASGDATLLSASPLGGADVLLKSDNPMASVPAQITVPEGATNQTFAIAVTPVQQVTPGYIYATRPGAGRICQSALWVYPPDLDNLEVPKEMIGGEKKNGTVTLGTVAPTGGIKVQLTVTGYLKVKVNEVEVNEVVVPAGSLAAGFEIEAQVRPSSMGYSSSFIIAYWAGKSVPRTIWVY
jgi:hypothetical protein